MNITTIEDLKKNTLLLTDASKKGLKHFDDLEKRIPRDEIDEYKEQLSEIFYSCTPENSYFEIVGSYRRGKQDSGDIDIIITNKNNNVFSFNNFIDELIKKNIIIEVLSRGNVKSLTIAVIQSSC